MSVFWLRAAVALYAIGLFHAFQVAIARQSTIFRAAMAAFYAAVVLHGVALVEGTRVSHRFPAEGFYGSVSLCAFLLGILFLFIYWRYRFESLAVFVFPIVFVMAGLAALQAPVGHWTTRTARDSWLAVHIVLVLLGYAALVLMALASIVYLLQERQLKLKRPTVLTDKLPPLGTLDRVISQTMGFGFVLITLGLVTGSTWAFVESGTSWLKDPKIAVSLFTWAFCLLMVFMRVTAGWRGRKAALMAILVVAFSAANWAVHLGLRSLLTQ